MEIGLQDLPTGKYVVAVSGGVDSVVLLDLLTRRPDLQLTVAHFDHGVRADSHLDREHVEVLAQKYELPFVYERAELGQGVSEDVARRERYRFLHRAREASGADAIITAHHQDDLLETIILNLLRGTGRRGLSSLKSTDIIKRPLLQVAKKELLRYAEGQSISWREDSTNSDEQYLRNYVRRRILPRFAEHDREVLLEVARRAQELNREIDQETASYLRLQPARDALDRHNFIMLPHLVAREVVAEWLLQNTHAELSRKLLERLVVAAKTGRAGTRVDVDKQYWLKIDRELLALEPRER